MAQQRHEDSDDDTYVRVGSAFERLETEEDVQKAKARKDKESYVTDEQGRRRFHGAFTGGFSAGYFNTVGSKEGWTPTSFVSSRGKKAEYSKQKPEDFMDQEDFGVHGIAPRAVATKEEFSQSTQQGTKRAVSDVLHTVIPGASALKSLVVPAHSTIGAKLLKALGWREGEGLGPKVMKYGSQQEKRIYGCYLSGEQDEMESQYLPKEAKGFMFAPKDSTPWQFEGKDDLHGIGYSGMQEQSVLGSVKATRALYGMSGEAFGLGALEEDEAEDDVYGVESMTSYDLTLAGERDISMEQKYGWTGSHETDILGLSAFIKASKQSVSSKTYPPPNVPRDFVPLHKFSSSHSLSENQNDHQKPLSSTQRSQLLSDQPGSVFSLLSAKDREKLKRMSDSVKQVAAGQKEGHTPEKEIDLHAAPDSSAKSTSNIKLFANDPAKQERYKAYLAGRDLQDGSSNRTEWERQREREEFARTARVVEPLGSSLSTRFTRSQKEVATEGSMEEEPESDAVQAAKADMFGILTRQVEEWHPHRVLCKRFNIPDPYPGSGLVGVATGNKEIKFSSSGGGSVRSISFLHTERLVPVDEPPDSGDEDGEQTQAQETSNMESTESAGGTPNDKDLNVASSTEVVESDEVERPSLDLFKAIFAENSDGSVLSSDESDVETTNESALKNLSNTTILEPTNQSGSRWQDLSNVTNHSMNISLPPPTLNQSYDNRRPSDSAGTEYSRPPEQPVECYGPSLPPMDIDQQEYTREPSPERRHKHHHTKRSHKKKDRKMEHKRTKHKHSKHK